MKNIILFAFILFAANMTAQVDFAVTPNPIVDFDIVTDSEIVGKAKIKNNSTETKEFTWERQVICGDSNDLTWFCDPNLCYIPSVSTQSFELEAGAEGPFELHGTFTGSADRSLMVIIKVWETANPDNAMDAMYEFSSCAPLSIDESKLAEIELFPNPATDNFTLTNVNNVDNIVIHNLLGTAVSQHIVTENANYDISELPTGLYLVQLFADSGEVIGTKKVYKK